MALRIRALRGVKVSWATWVQISHSVTGTGCWNSLLQCCHKAILCGTEHVSRLIHVLLIWSLYENITIFISNFVSGDLAQTGFWFFNEHLRWSDFHTLFQCFGTLGVGLGAWSPRFAQMCWPGAWAVIIVIVQPLSFSTGNVFSWIMEDTEKCWPHAQKRPF